MYCTGVQILGNINVPVIESWSVCIYLTNKYPNACLEEYLFMFLKLGIWGIEREKLSQDFIFQVSPDKGVEACLF